MIEHSHFSVSVHALIVTFILLILNVHLGEAQSLKGRIVAQVSHEDMKVINVGDIPDHTVMLVKAKGLAFLESGEVAEVMATEIIDDINGKATYRGYEILTFEDGSTVSSRFEGNSTTTEDGRFVDFEGTFTYMNGTGRFAGIEGGGTHEGRNHALSGAGFYVNFEGTFTLSSNR